MPASGSSWGTTYTDHYRNPKRHVRQRKWRARTTHTSALVPAFPYATRSFYRTAYERGKDKVEARQVRLKSNKLAPARPSSAPPSRGKGRRGRGRPRTAVSRNSTPPVGAADTARAWALPMRALPVYAHYPLSTSHSDGALDSHYYNSLTSAPRSRGVLRPLDSTPSQNPPVLSSRNFAKWGKEAVYDHFPLYDMAELTSRGSR
mmetsp:Transcript_2282/g.2688  ORF Transcript_2282/g.2688 Transcript_2282/m.2688 type:complete len:204 (+) Transcript_2282:57-668(+)